MPCIRHLLKQLISTALQHDFDLGIAAERVEEARARFRIVRAGELPLVGAQAQFVANRPSSVGSLTTVPPGTPLDSSYTQAGALLSWELDLWGRLRRLSESARAQYLATEEGRRGVIVSLNGNVPGDYFTLRCERAPRDAELRRCPGPEAGFRAHFAQRPDGPGASVYGAGNLLAVCPVSIKRIQKRGCQSAKGNVRYKDAVEVLRIDGDFAGVPAACPLGRVSLELAGGREGLLVELDFGR
jgi:hypothetical protein